MTKRVPRKKGEPPKKAGVGPPRRLGPRDPDLAALGQAIEGLMTEKELSQKALTERSGIAAKQIGEYVRGQGNPTFSNLWKLADALQVPLHVLEARAAELRAQQSKHKRKRRRRRAS